jgi:hypothetical protein
MARKYVTSRAANIGDVVKLAADPDATAATFSMSPVELLRAHILAVAERQPVAVVELLADVLNNNLPPTRGLIRERGPCRIHERGIRYSCDAVISLGEDIRCERLSGHDRDERLLRERRHFAGCVTESAAEKRLGELKSGYYEVRWSVDAGGMTTYLNRLRIHDTHQPKCECFVGLIKPAS